MELNKDNLYKEYIVNNLSRAECSKIFNCSSGLIQKRLKIYGIKKDKKAINETKKRMALNKGEYNIPKEDLYREYIINNLTTYECSKYFNCKETLVQKRLRDYNIKKDKRKIYENTAKTMLQKYGVNNSSKLDSALQKGQETNIRKYGAKTYAESKLFKGIMVEKAKDRKNFDILWDKNKLLAYIEALGFKPTTYELAQRLSYSVSIVRKHLKMYELQDYVDSKRSQTNLYWHDLIEQEFGIDMEYEGAIFGNQKRCDLYFEDKKIAIDINPTASHNTQFNVYLRKPETKMTRGYHQERAILSKKNGLFLYQIFDWDDKNKILLELNKILGFCEKINISECEIKEVNVQETRDFCKKYCLRDYYKTIYRCGLYYNNKLISLITLSSTRKLMFYSIKDVEGGLEKIFNYMISKVNPKNIIVYVDMGKENGDIYKNLGFVFLRYSKPNSLYAPEKSENKCLTMSQANSEFKKYGQNFETCKDYFNSKKWYLVYDAGNEIWLWENPNYNSEN